MFTRNSILVLSLTPLISCGGGKGSVNELEGTWISNCYLDSVNNDGNYIVSEISYQGSLSNHYYKVYGDVSCETLIYPGDTSVTYSLGDPIITGSGLNAIELNYSFSYEIDDQVIEGNTYTIISISDNTYYTALSPSRDLASRPTELDFNKIFTRQ